MTEVTTNGIVKWTNRDPASIVQASQAQGDSIETAFGKRERFDFVWANSAERTGQTGMVQGSRGYQIDTKTEYLYDNSNWRLATSYSEWNHGPQVVGTGVEAQATALTINNTLSTDTAFITTTGAGIINFVNPGIYAVSWTITLNAGAPGTQGYASVAYGPAGANIISLAAFALTGGVTVSIPFLRTTASNTTANLRLYQNSGANTTMSSILRIGRIS